MKQLIGDVYGLYVYADIKKAKDILVQPENIKTTYEVWIPKKSRKNRAKKPRSK